MCRYFVKNNNNVYLATHATIDYLFLDHLSYVSRNGMCLSNFRIFRPCTLEFIRTDHSHQKLLFFNILHATFYTFIKTKV